VKKGVNPFPSLSRLLKHVRDIHVMKGNGRIIHPDMRSKKCKASSNPKTAAVIKARSLASSVVAPLAHISGVQLNTSYLMPSNSPSLITTSGATMQSAPQAPVRPAPPPEPLFVAVPPRPQKLLHSEAYIRYIESLHAKKRKMTDWEKTLKATKENTKAPDDGKLPGHWLANGAGRHGSINNALWALRDFMMKDALNLHKVDN
jgi:protein polybromo-1